MSVINQALKDLHKRQQQGPGRARSVYQAPPRRGLMLALGTGAGVMGGILISYLAITHATAGAEPEARVEPGAIVRTAPEVPHSGTRDSVARDQVALAQRPMEPVTADSPVPHTPEPYMTAALTTESLTAQPHSTEPGDNSEPEVSVSSASRVHGAPMSVPARVTSAADSVADSAADFAANFAADHTAEMLDTTPEPASGALITVEYEPQADQDTQNGEPSEPSQGSMRVERVERSADELAAQRLAQAIEAIDDGRGRHGENLLLEALILKPDYTEARQRLAGYYYGRGFSGEALRVLQEGLALRPDNTALLTLMARIYEETNRPAEALRVLNRLVVQLPQHSDLVVLRAALANELGSYSSAAEDYRALLNLNPDQGIWWLGLGHAEEQQGDLAAAALAYEQALADERLDRESRNYVRSRLEVLNPW